MTGTLEVGGSETKIVKIANALSQSGYSVGIAYFNAPESLLDRIIPAVTVTHLHRRQKFSMASLQRLRALLADDDKAVLSVNFYPLLYVVPAVKYLPPRRGRLISLINTTDFSAEHRMHGHIYAPFIRRCDAIVFGCKAQQRQWTDKYRLPFGRSEVVYNGVDSERFKYNAGAGLLFRRDFGIPEDAIVIGGMGRFAPEKNFETAIRALANLISVGRVAYLILIGGGAEKRLLQDEARNRGVSEYVRMPGILEDVRPALSAMDIFLLPSWTETFSNAALEAMAMERPVVLSNIGGAREMIDHTVSGFLFEPMDVEALTGILVNLHDSPRLRRESGAAARKRILDRFQFETMVGRYKILIDSVDVPG